MKFSNSPGKETIGGYIRVYGRGDTLIVADASERIDGEPLFVKLGGAGPHRLSRIVPRTGRPRRDDLGSLREVGTLAAGD